MSPASPRATTRLQAGGTYFRLMDPVYTRAGASGTAILALRVARNHLNIQGVTHGGMLTTMADAALGINLAQARGWAASWPMPVATSRSGIGMC